MAAQTLTREQGYALRDARKAIRTSVDTLVTRTAFYAWNDLTEQWECTHDTLKVVHTRGFRNNTCFIWDVRGKQFTPCNCGNCGR